MKSVNIIIALLCFVDIFRACHAGAYTRSVFTSSDCSDASMVGMVFYPSSGPACTQTGCYEIVAGQFYGLENCIASTVSFPNDWSGIFFSSSDICEAADSFIGGKPNVCWIAAAGVNNDAYRFSGCNQDSSVTFQYSYAADCSTNELYSNVSSCAPLGVGYVKKVRCYDVPVVPVAEPVAAPAVAPITITAPSASPVVAPVANNNAPKATPVAKKSASGTLLGFGSSLILAVIAAL